MANEAKSHRVAEYAAVLTRGQADAMRRVRDRGPEAWCNGRGRAGGSVSRMFDRLKFSGLVSAPPYIVTPFGLRVLDAFDANRAPPHH